MPGPCWSNLVSFFRPLQKVCDLVWCLVIVVDWPFRVLPTAARTWFLLVPGECWFDLVSFSLLLQKVCDLIWFLGNINSASSYFRLYMILFDVDNINLTLSLSSYAYRKYVILFHALLLLTGQCWSDPRYAARTWFYLIPLIMLIWPCPALTIHVGRTWSCLMPGQC